MKKYEVEKQWVTEAGLLAVVIRSFGGHRCGYAGVEEGHVAFGKGYAEPLDCIPQATVDNVELGSKSPILLLTAGIDGDEDGTRVRRSLDILLDVHGGLTFSGPSGDGESDYPVATSVPVWWFGYDCAHYKDRPEIGGQSLEYCINQCESLAAQLKELE